MTETPDSPAPPVPDGNGAGPAAERLAAALAREARRQLAAPPAPGLYLVATPIGHLADITVRALAVLAGADRLYAEDTRHSRTLLAHYGISRALTPYHDHNGERERPRILAALAAGDSVALISDAGTPLIADPGFKLARAAIAAGHAVIPVPGPSAVLAALSASGLPTDTFLFAGFLPARSAQRRARIAELAAAPATLVLFETAPRLAETLADLADGLGSRPAAVLRELTKRHESARRDTLDVLAREPAAADTARGELVIVVGPPAARAASDDDIRRHLAPLLERERPADAARRVAEALGVPKSRVYGLAIGMKNEQEGTE